MRGCLHLLSICMCDKTCLDDQSAVPLQRVTGFTGRYFLKFALPFFRAKKKKFKYPAFKRYRDISSNSEC